MAYTGLSRKTGAEFSIWKTVTLGLHKTGHAYRSALAEAGCTLSHLADDIMCCGKLSCAEDHSEIALSAVSPVELGLKQPTMYGDAVSRGLKLGLALCPAEVGPALRLAYVEQPFGERLTIAMGSIPDTRGFSAIFTVEHPRIIPQHEIDTYVSANNPFPPWRLEPYWLDIWRESWKVERLVFVVPR